MDINVLTTRMAHNASRIQRLVEGVSAEEARWKPAADSWSILEVLNHLLDEEKEDFRVRLDIILHHPERPWPPIDPEGWVAERQYNQKDLVESLDKFLRAREESLAWVRGLSAPNGEAVYEAPWGPITAGDMFASWVAHDMLQMRQLVELHWAYTALLVEPYRTEYAGEW